MHVYLIIQMVNKYFKYDLANGVTLGDPFASWLCFALLGYKHQIFQMTSTIYVNAYLEH